MRFEEERAWQRELFGILGLEIDFVNAATAPEWSPISEKDVLIMLWTYSKNDVLLK